MTYYLLTQDDEPWKLPITLQHLSQFLIKPKVIRGFNGRLLGLKPTNWHEYISDQDQSYVHPAQIGAVLGHLAVLMCAISDGEEEFVVFEDDVMLAEDFLERLDHIVSNYSQNYDVIQLEHAHSSNVRTEKINDYLSHSYYPFCAAAIYWKHLSAISALRMLRPVDSGWDIMLIRKVYPFVRHAIATPPLATQRSMSEQWPSSIGSKPKN